MTDFNFIHNRAFDDRCTAFAPQVPQAMPGKPFWDYTPLDTGAIVQENGDVKFGLLAPDAKEVKVVFGLYPDRPLLLEKCEDGIFRGTLKYDSAFKGPKAFTFNVDGADMLCPYSPIYYSHGMAINYVEIPDPDADFLLMRDVPHGSVVSEYYKSEILGEEERCLVYLPPMYHEGGEYPVLFLLHGYGENETSWIYGGKVNHIMDNLIADKKATPFIVVMMNGMFHGKYNFATYLEPFTQSMIKECIPMIEKKYRVKKDKWNRGVAGFSNGSMQSCIIGLGNMDTFSHIGLLSGFMRRVGRPDTDLSKDMELNSHLKVMLDKENFEKEIKLFFRGIGGLDFKLDAFNVDDEICDENGISSYKNVERMVIEGYPHDWAIMRRLFHEFAQRVFR